MAVSYWGILREFNPSWFVANLTLILWPPFFLRRLIAPPHFAYHRVSTEERVR